jgi:16S rRNA (guanine527-N7)-methyltransferase
MLSMLDTPRIAALLAPFLGDTEAPLQLFPQLQTYLELLLRWNARINLTAVRRPEQIVTRHFGESLFAARLLREAGAFTGTPTLSDIGSGPGFPGIPIKLYAPEMRVTLVESNSRKATFLGEVARALELSGLEVYCGRAETLPSRAGVVTLRAVEKFQAALPTAARLVAESGTLCLLISQPQLEAVGRELGVDWICRPPQPIPLSHGRVVQIYVNNQDTRA